MGCGDVPMFRSPTVLLFHYFCFTPPPPIY